MAYKNRLNFFMVAIWITEVLFKQFLMDTSLSDIIEARGLIDAGYVGLSVSQYYLQKSLKTSILKN